MNNSVIPFKVIYIAGTVLVLSLLLLILVFGRTSQDPDTLPSLIEPTPITVSSDQNQTVSTVYDQKILNNLSAIAPVEIRFKNAVAKDKITYSITPAIKVFAQLDATGTLFTVKPVDYWIVDTTYTLTITSPSGNFVIHFKSPQAKFEMDPNEHHINETNPF